MTPAHERPTAGPPAAEFAAFVASLTYEDLPPSVAAWAKILIADNLGCAVGALWAEEARSLLRVAEPASARGATAIGAGPSSLPSAVFCNAQLSNLLDFDDMHDVFMPYHPGCLVVPVALGLAETLGAGGRELIVAVVVGYEVALRVGRAFGNQLWGGLPSTAAVDELAAAVTAAKLLSLDPAQVRNLFSILAMTPRGPATARARSDNPPGFRLGTLKGDFGTRAQAGLWSALKARAGLTGSPGLLEASFTEWHLAGLPPEAYDGLCRELGSRFQAPEVSLKPAPSCRMTHVPITAAWAALGGRRLDAGRVAEIVVTGVPRLAADHWIDMIDAQFSVPCTLALAAGGLEPGPAWYRDAAFQSADVRALASKVRQVRDPAAERIEILEGRPTCGIEIRLKGGGSLEGRCEHLKGSPDNPLSEPERAAKFSANTALAPYGGEALREAIDGLDAAASIRGLSAALALCAGHD